MNRVYLDSNVFRALKKPENSDIAQKLLVAKDNTIFFFSQAHIDDLSRDKTDKKFLDYEFMEKFTDSDCISFDPIKERFYIQSKTPIQLFEENNQKEIIEQIGLNNGVDPEALIDLILNFRDVPALKEYSIIFETLESLKMLSANRKDTYTVDSLPEVRTPEMDRYLKELGIGNKVYSSDEFEKIAGNINDKLQNEPEIFRLGRRLSKTELGMDKFNISINEINFNESLRDTIIGKSFTELVESSYLIFKDYPLFNSLMSKYIYSFMLLNILGIDEENNKKANFKKLESDANHSFYGMCCDYVVSSDIGFITKTKFLYNLYGINSKVVFWDEFVKEFSFIKVQFSDAMAFLKNLRFDINHGLVIRTKNSILTDGKSKQIKLTQKYFYYFNTIEAFTQTDFSLIILFNHRPFVNEFVLFKEIISVTNKAIEIFGTDDNFKDKISETDLSELSQNNWGGRVWNIGDGIIELKLQEEDCKFNMKITL
jgi:hypothetical protein